MAEDSDEYEPLAATQVVPGDIGDFESAMDGSSSKPSADSVVPSGPATVLDSAEHDEAAATEVLSGEAFDFAGLQFESWAEDSAGDPASGEEPVDGETSVLDPSEADAFDTAEQDVPEALDTGDGDSPEGVVFEGRFRVDELIGEGGMGRVYKGTQLSVGRPVAIKVLHKDISQDEDIRRRFMREARLISSFTHPNTVRLYDFGEADGHLFIAMEFVEGVPLSDVVADGPVDLSFAFEVMDQVCGSLVEAHKADVVHRDLKPENICLTRSADDRLQVKLLDFGIAHIEPENDGKKETLEDLTQRGVIVGTPEYMAPEQARGAGVSAATDVYSLGVILYELLSGKLPIVGESHLETLFLQVSEEATPIAEVMPDCPPALVEVVHKFLQKEPSDRVPSAAEVRQELQAARRELDVARVSELPDGPFRDVLGEVTRPGPDRGPVLRARVPNVDTLPGNPDAGALEPPAANPGGSEPSKPSAPSESSAPSEPVLSTSAAPSTEFQVPGLDPSAEDATGQPGVRPVRDGRKRLVFVAIAGLIVVSLLGTALFVGLTPSDPSAEEADSPVGTEESSGEAASSDSETETASVAGERDGEPESTVD